MNDFMEQNIVYSLPPVRVNVQFSLSCMHSSISGSRTAAMSRQTITTIAFLAVQMNHTTLSNIASRLGFRRFACLIKQKSNKKHDFTSSSPLWPTSYLSGNHGLEPTRSIQSLKCGKTHLNMYIDGCSQVGLRADGAGESALPAE